jgi:hypothetical protein
VLLFVSDKCLGYNQVFGTFKRRGLKPGTAKYLAATKRDSSAAMVDNPPKRLQPPQTRHRIIRKHATLVLKTYLFIVLMGARQSECT